VTAITAILYAPGTNCHEETAASIEFAGGRSELVPLSDLLEGQKHLRQYQAVVIPGGFSYGDHLGAGRIFATLLTQRLQEELNVILETKIPMLGICNGFQVLTEAGILPARSPRAPRMALLENQSGHFEDRKVRLLVTSEDSFWTRGCGGRILNLPSAHAEGKAMFDANSTERARIALHYVDAQGQATGKYPENPSDAPGGIAGVFDSTGMIFGLMPHPERASLPVHYSQDGMVLFQNLVRWLKSN
jgi:phosphoribosylformylglycinamidine synthase